MGQRRVTDGNTPAAQPETPGQRRRGLTTRRMHMKRSQRIGRTGLAMAFCISLTLTGAVGEDQPTRLSEVLKDRDADFVPDHLGETFLIAGTLTTDPMPLTPSERNFATLANLQDETGGIVLVAIGRAVLFWNYKRGDVVQVKGELSQHNGMEGMVVSEITRIGTRALPAPHEVLVADLAAERHS